MTADQFYKQYGNGRSRTQFDADCNAFFGSLAAIQNSPSSDVDKTTRKNQFLHRVAINGTGFNGHGRHNG